MALVCWLIRGRSEMVSRPIFSHWVSFAGVLASCSGAGMLQACFASQPGLNQSASCSQLLGAPSPPHANGPRSPLGRRSFTCAPLRIPRTTREKEQHLLSVFSSCFFWSFRFAWCIHLSAVFIIIPVRGRPFTLLTLIAC